MGINTATPGATLNVNGTLETGATNNNASGADATFNTASFPSATLRFSGSSLASAGSIASASELQFINTNVIHLPAHVHFLLPERLQESSLVWRGMQRWVLGIERSFADLYNQGAEGVYIWEAHDVPTVPQRWDVLKRIGDRQFLNDTFSSLIGPYDGNHSFQQRVIK